MRLTRQMIQHEKLNENISLQNTHRDKKRKLGDEQKLYLKLDSIKDHENLKNLIMQRYDQAK